MRRRKSAIFFLILGISLITLAVALIVGWIILNLQQIVLLVFGIIFFAMIITGVVLNTTFLIREIRKNEQQDAFLNAVTHELKTPIASIKLYLETLKTRDVDEKKRREFYDVMLADSDRLLTTVEQVLQASRTREKSRLLNIAPIDIEKLLEDCAALIRIRYKLKNDTVRVFEVPPDTFVAGDLRELRTAIENLLDNAVKYSNYDPEITIKTRIHQSKYVEIRIRDQGIGLSPGELKRIFRRFYRVPDGSAGAVKGTGLGLYIVRSILKKHKGKIFVRSRGEGRGSSFIVRLPKFREELQKEQTPEN